MTETSIDSNPIAPEGGLLANPVLGNVLTLAAGLGFFVLGISLPLVGPAAALTTHYERNRTTFHAVAFVALALSVLALVTKLKRRKQDGSPFPKTSAGLVGLYVLIIVLERLGAFAI